MGFKGTKKEWLRDMDATNVHTVEIPIAYVGGENKEISIANAKLIATAPELLEALQAALNHDLGWTEKAKLIINKALN